jgi:hypothetical protein
LAPYFEKDCYGSHLKTTIFFRKPEILKLLKTQNSIMQRLCNRPENSESVKIKLNFVENISDCIWSRELRFRLPYWFGPI